MSTPYTLALEYPWLEGLVQTGSQLIDDAVQTGSQVVKSAINTGSKALSAAGKVAKVAGPVGTVATILSPNDAVMSNERTALGQYGVGKVKPRNFGDTSTQTSTGYSQMDYLGDQIAAKERIMQAKKAKPLSKDSKETLDRTFGEGNWKYNPLTGKFEFKWEDNWYDGGKAPQDPKDPSNWKKWFKRTWWWAPQTVGKGIEALVDSDIDKSTWQTVYNIGELVPGIGVGLMALRPWLYPKNDSTPTNTSPTNISNYSSDDELYNSIFEEDLPYEEY